MPATLQQNCLKTDAWVLAEMPQYDQIIKREKESIEA